MRLMHNLIVLINLDNDAFSGAAGEREVARLLREAADKFEKGKHSGNIMDVNGNTVGSFELTP
jgi:hypothetical protein